MIYVPDVETIMDALEGLLSTVSNVAPSTGVIPTVTRVWQPWENVAKISQPALIIVEPGETVTDRRGQQPALKLDVMILCYMQMDPADAANPPNTRLNNFISAIRAALLPSGSDIVRNAQTLGGLVSNVFIDGKIVKDAGIIDGQGSIMIPMTIIIT